MFGTVKAMVPEINRPCTTPDNQVQTELHPGSGIRRRSSKLAQASAPENLGDARGFGAERANSRSREARS